MDEILEFGENQNHIDVKVAIVDDEQWEPDEDFYLEIYDPDNAKKLQGHDTESRITIIDDDKPGELGFLARYYKVRAKDIYCKLKVIRAHGCDGTITCTLLTKSPEGIDTVAVEGEDYLPVSKLLTFESGEVEKDIEIEILPKPNDIGERLDVFEVRLDDATGGALFSKR